MFHLSLVAQPNSSLQVLTRFKADGVWIRWAPSDDFGWHWGNQHGYLVERLTLLDNGEVNGEETIMLTPSALKPWPKNLFDDSISSDEVLAMGEILYGENESESLSILQRKHDLENRFAMAMLLCDLSIEAASSAGLFLIDKSAIRGKRYIYRVKIADAGASAGILPGASIIRVEPSDDLIPVKDIQVTFKDLVVTLSWPVEFHRGYYSSYHIERSVNGRDFTRLTDFPYVHLEQGEENGLAHYVDSLEVNNKTYFYRIAGITPFGERGPYSEVVQGQGKDDLTGTLVLKKVALKDERTGRVMWDFPTFLEDKISGFQVLQSPNPNSPFQPVHKKSLSRKVREFDAPLNGYNQYFIVRALDDKGGLVTQSFPYLIHLEDNTPPASPVNLKGSIDTTGVASLVWEPVKDQDLIGYRVFRSHALNHEFVERSKEIFPDPQFKDTVNLSLLNRKIYYKVIAVDKNFNTSGFSLPLLLLRPDNIAPIPAPYLKVQARAGGIGLQWINSTSKDIMSIAIFRREKNKDSLLLFKGPAARTEYLDASALPGVTYRYYLSFYDSSGNHSTTASGDFVLPHSARPFPKQIAASANTEQRMISLAWKKGEAANKIFIYRKVNDGPLLLYETIAGDLENFVDKKVWLGNRYTYHLQLTFSDGGRSELSEAIEVLY